MTRIACILAALLVAFAPALAQDSDFAIKKGFEERVTAIERAIDNAKAVTDLDAIREDLADLETKYGPHQEFLNKALYPSGYDGTMKRLRETHLIAYDRVYLIQTQGVRISDLEAHIQSLTFQLDSLGKDRNRLYAELEAAKKSQADMRGIIRRLRENVEAKDRLLFALTDSIFLPYGKDLSGASELQREAVGRKLEQANVLTRVYDVADDNVKFLDRTQLQPKDYANLIDQQKQFAVKWQGLREKMVAAVMPAQAAAARSRKAAGEAAVTPQSAAAAQVDSLVSTWNAKLQSGLWGDINKEFTGKSIVLQPFTDSRSFAQSLRAYIATLKTSGEDPTVFVEQVWKEKIDKEWRDVLMKESMLGAAEYTAIDQLVRELHQEKVGGQFMIYALLLVAIAAVVWWFFFRKPKPPQA